MSVFEIDAVTGAQPSSGQGYLNDHFYMPVFDEKSQNLVDKVKGAANDVKEFFSGSPGIDTTGMYKYYDPNGASPSSADFSFPEYPNAALSSLYGMDQATAYQEALANTAIQRRMLDYKAAGLNPVLAARYNSGADSFSGSVAYPMSFGASQGSSASGSSSGASYGGSSARSALRGFNLGNFLSDRNYQSAIAALASAGTMAVTKNFQLGAAAYYGVQGIFKTFFGHRK